MELNIMVNKDKLLDSKLKDKKSKLTIGEIDYIIKFKYKDDDFLSTILPAILNKNYKLMIGQIDFIIKNCMQRRQDFVNCVALPLIFKQNLTNLQFYQIINGIYNRKNFRIFPITVILDNIKDLPTNRLNKIIKETYKTNKIKEANRIVSKIISTQKLNSKQLDEIINQTYSREQMVNATILEIIDKQKLNSKQIDIIIEKSFDYLDYDNVLDNLEEKQELSEEQKENIKLKRKEREEYIGVEVNDKFYDKQKLNENIRLKEELNNNNAISNAIDMTFNENINLKR